MAPTFIPEIVSVFLTMGIIGLVTGLVFWAIRRTSNEISTRRIRRKLSAAAMAKEAGK
ncbi:MAG: hypothetical protein GOP50_02370 [Candidatus Heimdallarchaeota archaeon]|nr:hypothetical protein [Candidatus Heimdallarchaeota archaeon]